MADYMAAEILLGGNVRRSLAKRLCQVIADQHVSLEWGDRQFVPDSADDLMAARSEIGGALVLRLCDPEARWGEFAALEQFLKSRRIAFSRITEGKYEYDGERIDYRPGHRLMTTTLNADQEPVAKVVTLRKTEAAMKRAANLIDEGDIEATRKLLSKALKAIRKNLPAELPPLTSLELI